MIAILIAIFLGAWGLAPSQPQPAQSVQQQSKPDQQHAVANPSVNTVQTKSNDFSAKQGDEQGYGARVLQFVREYNAEIVALSTAVIAGFTIALFWSGERHSKRELRAYLSVNPRWVWWFNATPPQIIWIEAGINNHGKTPAFNITNFYEIEVRPANFQPPTEAHQHRDEEGAVYPIQDLTANLVAKRIFTSQEVADVLSGVQRIFLWGTVHYRDAFKRRRYTRFSASVGGADFAAWLYQTPPNAMFRWSYGHHHNNAN
jgi:hypothetical protein